MIEEISITLTSIVIDDTFLVDGILGGPLSVCFKKESIKENLLIQLSFEDSSITIENLMTSVEILLEALSCITLKYVVFVSQETRETTFAYLMMLQLQKLGIVCSVFYEKKNALRWLCDH